MSANLPESVRARLNAASRKNAWENNRTLARYATEGFLRRLAASPHRDALTLKGGNLFVVWLGGVGYRPTLDTDFLCRGDASPRHLAEMFRDIAAIAEKLHAMVEHGELNSRMKDFYDVWFLASHFAFEWATLRTALEKSLSRRGVWPLPEVPLALAPGFADAPPRLSLWSGFVRRTRLQDSAPTFPEAVAAIRAFLLPVLFPPTPVPKDWTPEKGWIS